MALIFLCLVLFLASSATACDRCVHQSQAAYYSDPSPLSRGACGYGSMALGFYGGHLVGGSSSLFKSGAGCGACFQMRCKDSALCRSAGTTAFLFDQNKNNNQTDFVLSSNAFMAMAAKGKAQQLLKRGTIGVEYKRVPCTYGKQNLAIRVEESSQKPHYLAIKFLYQGGQTEIVGVDIGPATSGGFNAFMTRNYGAVWDTRNSKVPGGALQMRLVVTGGFDGKNVWVKNALPADWRSGVIYDTRVQITDIAQEGCSPCDDSNWG